MESGHYMIMIKSGIFSSGFFILWSRSGFYSLHIQQLKGENKNDSFNHQTG